MGNKPGKKAIKKVGEAITGGATVKEAMDKTGYAKDTVYASINVLMDEGQCERHQLEGSTFEYYFIGDPKELEDFQTKERKEKITGKRLDQYESAVYRMVRTKGMTIGELSRSLNKPMGVSKEFVYKVLQSLRDKGFSVSIDEARKTAELDRESADAKTFEPLELEPLYKHKITIGVTGDTQFGSKYQQPTIFKTVYEMFDKEHVDFVIHMGDLVDGIKMYRGHDQEIFLHSADEQADYTLNIYPERKEYKTYIISGNHDLSFKKIAGYDIVKHICAQRDDLVYKGELGAHTFKVKNLTFDLIHPSGGVPYAKSYRIQKVIEGAIGDVIARLRVTKDLSIIPHFMLLGHLHIANYTPHIGIDGFMVPCMQAQTPYLVAKGLMPEVGCYIIHVYCDDDWNINRLLLDHRKMNTYIKEGDY